MARSTAAFGQGHDDPEESSRPPMPEPIFTESVGDIDGRAGDVEGEINGSKWHALQGGADEISASAEVEWIATRRLGFRLEPGVTSSQDGTVAPKTSLGGSGGLSLRLVNDYEDDFHLQAELGGRYPADLFDAAEPGESALPYSLDLRAGLRRGRWTLRADVGGEAGGAAAHAPVRGGLGVFTPFGATERFGFWGVEMEADAGRATPIVVAPNVVATLLPLGIPLRVGLGLPWAVGAGRGEPSVGLFVRLFFEAEREVAYAESGRP